MGLSNHSPFPGTTGSGNYVIICDVRPREQAEVLVTLGDLVGKKKRIWVPNKMAQVLSSGDAISHQRKPLVITEKLVV